MRKSPRRSSLLTWPEIICVAAVLGVLLYLELVICGAVRFVQAITFDVVENLVASSGFLQFFWSTEILVHFGGTAPVVVMLILGLRWFPERTSTLCCWGGLLLFLGAVVRLFHLWEPKFLTLGDFADALTSSIRFGDAHQPWNLVDSCSDAALMFFAIAFGSIVVIGCFELQAEVRLRMVLQQPQAVRRARLLAVFREGAMAKGRSLWLLLIGPVVTCIAIVWFNQHVTIVQSIEHELKATRLLGDQSASQIEVALTVEVSNGGATLIDGVELPSQGYSSAELTGRIWASSGEARARAPVLMKPDRDATYQDLLDGIQRLRGFGFRKFYLTD